MQDHIYAILRSALEDMRALRAYDDPEKTHRQIDKALAYLQAQHALAQPVPPATVAQNDGWYWFRGTWHTTAWRQSVDCPVCVFRGTVQHAGGEWPLRRFEGEFWRIDVPK